MLLTSEKTPYIVRMAYIYIASDTHIECALWTIKYMQYYICSLPFVYTIDIVYLHTSTSTHILTHTNPHTTLSMVDDNLTQGLITLSLNDTNNV